MLSWFYLILKIHRFSDCFYFSLFKFHGHSPSGSFHSELLSSSTFKENVLLVWHDWYFVLQQYRQVGKLLMLFFSIIFSNSLLSTIQSCITFPIGWKCLCGELCLRESHFCLMFANQFLHFYWCILICNKHYP